MDKLETEIETSELDFDANEEQWKNYKEIYTELVIHTEKLYLDTNKKRLIGKFDYSKGFTQIDRSTRSKTSIVLSGDSFFNFNEKKMVSFNSIPGLNAATKKQLKSFSNYHQTNENCVLMPVTGGMNNVKGKTYFKGNHLLISGVGAPPKTAYDRPDTLVYLIDQFYKTKEKYLSLKEAGLFYTCSIFRDSISTLNFPAYYDFMNSFPNAFEFCKLFFKLDKGLFERMKESGGKPIKDEADLLSYIKLAEDYWNYRKSLNKGAPDTNNKSDVRN